MVWLFEGSDGTIRVETRYSPSAKEHVLILRRPDGSYQTERYHDVASLSARFRELEERLRSERRACRGPFTQGDDWWKI